MDTTLDINDRETDSDQVYALKARIRDLEAAFGFEWRAPRVLHLTKHENRLLGLLVARHSITHQGAYQALYGTRLDPPEPPIINVYICKVRRKLRPFAVHIWTQRGLFGIDAESLARINSLYLPGEITP